MEKKYWQQRWELSEIGFNQSKPNKIMQRFFPSLNLKSGNLVFVPLCGKSIDMIWLAEKGYKVIGVELSDKACKAFFNEYKISFFIHEMDEFKVFRSDKIILFAGDFFKLNKTLLGHIDAVYDRAALIALPEELRSRYAKKISSLLTPQVKILLITTTYDEKEMQGPPFSVNEKEIEALFKKDFDMTQVYSKSLEEIPEHLMVKGLQQAVEKAYVLIKKNPDVNNLF